MIILDNRKIRLWNLELFEKLVRWVSFLKGVFFFISFYPNVLSITLYTGVCFLLLKTERWVRQARLVAWVWWKPGPIYCRAELSPGREAGRAVLSGEGEGGIELRVAGNIWQGHSCSWVLPGGGDGHATQVADFWEEPAGVNLGSEPGDLGDFFSPLNNRIHYGLYWAERLERRVWPESGELCILKWKSWGFLSALEVFQTAEWCDQN